MPLVCLKGQSQRSGELRRPDFPASPAWVKKKRPEYGQIPRMAKTYLDGRELRELLAAHPQKAVLEPAALEVRLELPLDIGGQRLTLHRQVRLIIP